MRVCPVCKNYRNDVRMRRTWRVQKGDPEKMKNVEMCDECWDGAGDEEGSPSESHP